MLVVVVFPWFRQRRASPFREKLMLNVSAGNEKGCVDQHGLKFQISAGGSRADDHQVGAMR